MTTPLRAALPLLLMCAMGFPSARAADQINGYVYTEILPPDFQSGMKSKHNFFIDFKAKTVTHTHRTGTTDLGVGEVGSVRDEFTVAEKVFTASGVSFRIKGQTASGVGFMPSIDYNFVLTVSPAGDTTVKGCHDGYPAYRVVVDGKTRYERKHEPHKLGKLYGDCDVEVQ